MAEPENYCTYQYSCPWYKKSPEKDLLVDRSYHCRKNIEPERSPCKNKANICVYLRACRYAEQRDPKFYKQEYEEKKEPYPYVLNSESAAPYSQRAM
jgi:hypothetical protein